MRKKVLALMLSAAMAAVAVTGCSSSKKETEAQTKAQTEAQTTEAASTEAAAATAAMMKASAYPHEEKNIHIDLTRPYAFLILDNETGNIVFIGKITDPKTN